MRTIFQMTLLIVLALMLTACAECTQDPSQAGFFCGVKNISEGTYGQREVLLRRESEQAEALARQRGGQVHTLQAQEASLATEKQDLQTKLASLQAELDQAERNPSASDNVSPQEIEELRREIRRLENRINEILELQVVE